MTKPAIDGTRESIAVTASLLGVALLFLLGTMLLTGEARIVPVSVLLPLIPLLGYALWHDLESLTQRAPGASDGRTSDLRVLGWILTLPALVTVTGLVAGSALFVAFWLRRRSGERWRTSIASGLATALALWLVGATVIEGLPRGGLLLSLLAG